MQQIEQEIGNRIRGFRKSKGLTIDELSAMIYKSKATLSKYEKGQLSVSLAVIYRICEALNIDPIQLLPQQANKPREITLAKGSANFFSEQSRYYTYYYDGRNSSVIHNVLDISGDIDEGKFLAFLYMNISDYDNYVDCENTYKGQIEHFDALSKIILTNQDTQMETFMINVFASFKDVDTKWGLASGISFRPMMPISTKMLISKRPLEDITKEELMFSKDDYSKMKLYNMLSIL